MQANKTHVYSNSDCYLYMCAICFVLYLGHPQACQYKNLIKEDIISIPGAPCFSHYFYTTKI